MFPVGIGKEVVGLRRPLGHVLTGIRVLKEGLNQLCVRGCFIKLCIQSAFSSIKERFLSLIKPVEAAL